MNEQYEVSPPLEPILDRFLTRRMRILICLSMLALSPVVWLAIKPYAWLREVEVTMTPQAGADRDLALEWQERGGGPWNGIWVDLCERSPGKLSAEIRLSGKPAGPGITTFGFHLYEVRAGNGAVRRTQLKAALSLWNKNPEQARAAGWEFEGLWKPGDGELGGIYCQTAGRVRFPLPPEASGTDVTFETEKLKWGGDVTFSVGDAQTTVNTYAPEWESPLVKVPGAIVFAAGEPIVVRTPLPAYPIADLRISRERDRTPLILSRVVMHTRLFGVSIADRAFEWETNESTASLGDGRVQVIGETVRTATPIRTRIQVHAMGVGVVAAALLFFWLLLVHVLVPACRVTASQVNAAFLAWRGPHVLPPQRRPAFGVAFSTNLAIIAAVHVWMAWWAPILYPPDSVDYIFNAQKLFETRSIDHFGAWRLPGVSFVLLPFIMLFSHPENALALVQGFGSVLMAVMVFDAARRFMPRPAALVAMLLVGLDPPTLVWERHVMSEWTFAFAATLWMWLLVQLVLSARPATGSEHPRYIGASLWAACLGLVTGFSPLIRGNAQLVLLITPPAIVFALWGFNRLRSAIALAGVAALCSAIVVVPWIVHIDRKYGQPAIMIGNGLANLLFTWNGEQMDINQTRLYDASTMRAVYMVEVPANDPFKYLQRLNSSPRLLETPGVHSWIRSDQRCTIAAEESRMRHGGPVWREMVNGFAYQAFLLGERRYPATSFWAMPLFGERVGNADHNWYMGPKQIIANGWDPVAVTKIYNRTEDDPSRLTPTSANPKLFHAVYNTFEKLRTAIGLLWIVGGIIAVREWNRPLMIIWGTVFVTILALAYLVFGGEGRYVEPYYPLMTLLAVFGFARILQYISTPRKLPAVLSSS